MGLMLGSALCGFVTHGNDDFQIGDNHYNINCVQENPWNSRQRKWDMRIRNAKNNKSAFVATSMSTSQQQLGHKTKDCQYDPVLPCNIKMGD